MFTGPHVFQSRAHIFVERIFVAEFFALQTRQRFVSQQLFARLAQFLDARLRHVLRVRLHTRLFRRQLATAVARRIKFVARILQRLLQLAQTQAHRLQLILQFAIAQLCCVALGGPLDLLLRQSCVFQLALLFLRRRRLNLALQLVETRSDFRHHRFQAVYCCRRTAPPLFQRGHTRPSIAGLLRRFIAPLAQFIQAALRRLHLAFESCLLLVVLGQLAPLRGDSDFALAAFDHQSLHLALVCREALPHTNHFAVELL